MSDLWIYDASGLYHIPSGCWVRLDAGKGWRVMCGEKVLYYARSVNDAMGCIERIANALAAGERLLDLTTPETGVESE